MESILLALVTTVYFMQSGENTYSYCTSKALKRSMDLHTWAVNIIFMYNVLVVCPTRENEIKWIMKRFQYLNDLGYWNPMGFIPQTLSHYL